jgi:tRNA threonylcarbamoyladenosine biosynthesis protein TsaE
MNKLEDISQLFVVETTAPAETASLGALLATEVTSPIVIALEGDLGTGKTEFVRGFAAASGCEEVVSSPTFAILNSYQGERGPVHHFDLYRIRNEAELAELGFDEYVFGEDTCLIEWAERAAPLLPEGTVRIRFEHLGGTRRRISRLS